MLSVGITPTQLNFSINLGKISLYPLFFKDDLVQRQTVMICILKIMLFVEGLQLD